jgi:hypothetical protein
MNYEKWKAGKKAGINFANCYHFGEDTNESVCGAMAVHFVKMPGLLPDMPVCQKHKEFYSDLTEDDILAMILSFAMEEEDEEYYDES